MIVRVLKGERGGDLVYLRLGLRLRHAVFQPPDHIEVIVAAPLLALGQPGGRPDVAGFTAEPPLPQPMTNDRDARTVGTVVVCREKAPQRGTQAEERKKTSCHAPAVNAFRLVHAG